MRNACSALLLVDWLLHVVVTVRWLEWRGIAALIHKVFTVRVQSYVLLILKRSVVFVDLGISCLLIRLFLVVTG